MCFPLLGRTCHTRVAIWYRHADGLHSRPRHQVLRCEHQAAEEVPDEKCSWARKAAGGAIHRGLVSFKQSLAALPYIELQLPSWRRFSTGRDPHPGHVGRRLPLRRFDRRPSSAGAVACMDAAPRYALNQTDAELCVDFLFCCSSIGHHTRAGASLCCTALNRTFFVSHMSRGPCWAVLP
jgi:hypothetical protein